MFLMSEVPLHSSFPRPVFYSEFRIRVKNKYDWNCDVWPGLAITDV